MSDEQRVELRGLKAAWHDARTEQLYARVETRLSRRRRAVRAALASAALVSLVAVVAVAFRWHQTGQAASAASGVRPGLSLPSAIHLREGSEIKVDPRTSELEVVEESATRVQLRLVRGSARSSVVPNPARTFEVQAGAVTVRVVGTDFAVERRGENAWVEVFRGKVRVSWGSADEHVFLGSGESGLFPRANAASSTETAVVVGSAETTVAEAEAPPTAVEQAREATQVYRKHVARRDYRGAYALLAQHPTLAGDTVKDLLVAADVARLSEHPAAAVPYLQRIVREHPRDERAPMAAFTLGRTLSGLGRTREAMDMFGRVRSAWPSSALGEDALLRQAEAAAKLGDFATAARLSQVYDRDYPQGRRRAEIRRSARLE